jgi:hypothetical protein
MPTARKVEQHSLLKQIHFLHPLLILLVMLLIHGCAVRPFPNAPIKYFYIDKTGKKVLDGIGYYGDSFHEGLALVCDEYRDDGDLQPFRYIDHSGKTRFTITAYEAHPFSEGLATIRAKVNGVQGGCAGYIDKNGHWTLAPRFYGYGDSFSDGLALVSTPDWKLQYIDHTGKQQIDADKTFASYRPRPWHQALRPFSEGRALVIIGRDRDQTPWQYGYIDKHGNWKIELNELGGAQFCEGLARRFRTGHPREKVRNGKVRATFIDSTGKEILKLPHDAGNFSEGLCSIADHRISCDLTTIRYADDTSTRGRGYKQGYCNRNGDVVIKPQFEYAREFSDGLAAVLIDGKFGYIDKTGKLVISPQFAYAGDFSEGMAVVVPFDKQRRRPMLKLWGQPSGKYFARERVEWVAPEAISD